MVYSRYSPANILCSSVFIASFFLIQTQLAVADEIRIVDTRGLVRAVKVVRGSVKMVVTLESLTGLNAKGECLANNVDGLAAEKRVAITSSSECIFNGVGAGSWLVSVPTGFTWRVKLYEQ